MKPASFSDFKRVQKLSLNDFNRWMTALYQTAFEAGLREGESELDEAVILDEAKLLQIILSVKGVGQKRAELIVDKILSEENENGIEVG